MKLDGLWPSWGCEARHPEWDVRCQAPEGHEGEHYTCVEVDVVSLADEPNIVRWTGGEART